MPDDGQANAIASPWLLRIELDRKRMTDKKLTMEAIAQKIKQYFKDDLQVMYSDDNAAKLALHLRLTRNPDNKPDGEEQVGKMEDDQFLRVLDQYMLTDLTLQGIESIAKVYMHKPTTDDKKRVEITPHGEFHMIPEWLLETDGTALLKVGRFGKAQTNWIFRFSVIRMWTRSEHTATTFARSSRCSALRRHARQLSGR